jgi:hypothetical protein
MSSGTAIYRARTVPKLGHHFGGGARAVKSLP